MEAMMLSSQGCPNVCPARQWPVSNAHFQNWSCTCVDDPQFDVGVVLAAGASCPKLSGRSTKIELVLSMDDEDNQNQNSRSGFIGTTVYTSNTKFRFCAVPGLGFQPSTSGNYSVVRMGINCPPGSVSMSRFFDNEDNQNANSTDGHVPPNFSDSQGTRIEFCQFRASASGSTSPFPNIAGPSYGVFAPASIGGAIQTGFVKTDDEDTDNINDLQGDFGGSDSWLQQGGSSPLCQ